MCGRVVWQWDKGLGVFVKRWLDDPIEREEVRRVAEKNRHNVPPASHLPFMISHAGRAQLEIARWGFPIPQRPNGVFNTRIEKAYDSPMWRGMIGKSHAVLAVNGFYEWRRDGKRKTPHYIQRADGDPMLLAALTGFRTIDDESRRCASVVTCEPNAQMGALHDRMPVILEPAGLGLWLHTDGNRRTIDELTQPSRAELEIYRVTDRVNSTENDDPTLHEQVGQRTLF